MNVKNVKVIISLKKIKDVDPFHFVFIINNKMENASNANMDINLIKRKNAS